MFRRKAKESQLPVYEKLQSPNTETGNYSNEDDLSDISDDSYDDESDYSSSSSPSTNHSRQTSSSHSSTAIMLPKRRAFEARPRRPGRPYFYRLPNKVIRYLCLGMMTTIIIFIVSLVRASQLENRRIANGDIDRAKAPAPPAPWESFEFLTRYYGGVKSLLPLSENVPQYPRDQDEQPYMANDTGNPQVAASDVNIQTHTVKDGPFPNSKPFSSYPGSVLVQDKAEIVECFLDAQGTVRVPSLQYFEGRPDGFPQHVMGSYDLLSLPEDVCFERFGKFGPYGFGYSVSSGGLGVGEHGEREGVEAVWQDIRQVDYRTVDWADAQQRCFQANAKRFKPLTSRFEPSRGFYIHGEATEAKNSSIHPRDSKVAAEQRKGDKGLSQSDEPPATQSQDLPRTAVVVRCWDEYPWTAEDIANLRSLISELSLASGARYDVHLLVQVRNDAKHPVWADDETYRQRIKDTIPQEFQGLVTLWTETQMLSLYQGIHDLFSRGPDLPLHGVYRGLQMAMQFFAYNHPEYDYFWQWEMDMRYTGHYLDLLTKMERWAQEQPRKGLWERSARFYLPEVHGSWEDFRQMARVQTEMGTTSADNMWKGLPGKEKAPSEVTKGEQTIWGPVRPADPNDWFEHEDDPEPPTVYEKDKYTWGVGEEADLITLNPLFDPEGTTWLLANDITGYNESAGNGKPPRRAQIITASRMSKRMLLKMHRETAFKKHHAFPEMWPATIALHHGYKAVFVPHPVYVDREWPVEYLAQNLNAGKNGATGGSRMSVFGQREHNLRGLSWFYNSGFAHNLYRRWLGLKVNNDGGEQFEMTADESKSDTTVPDMRGGEGRMCLPPMLLHPVKEIILPVEEEIVEGVEAGEVLDAAA
ncbi:uncharacterized protein E0L32_000661 [Thyridium curvatum]|uniref:Uncharacterized protein n=1 Tax=Thyridium curvatum TaxID=1093900 RepID=A0A507B3D9_9PEZI|nr:uncharacterized protein E0L32_000661 [Thyridium curvatum]TPX14267.1 hypothetical protein E0L32_000661 [Thyridium curvatum]